MDESGNWVMNVKRGTWCNEHWLLYKTDESMTSISETNNKLYVNYLNLNVNK